MYRALLWQPGGSLTAAQAEIKPPCSSLLQVRLLFVSRPRANSMRKIAKRLPGRMRRRFGPAADTLASSLELVDWRAERDCASVCVLGFGQSASRWARPGPRARRLGLIWYSPIVPMRPETVRRYLDFLVPTMRKYALEPLVTLTSLSERCFDSSVPLIFDRGSEAAKRRARACYMELLEADVVSVCALSRARRRHVLAHRPAPSPLGFGREAQGRGRPACDHGAWPVFARTSQPLMLIEDKHVAISSLRVQKKTASAEAVLGLRLDFNFYGAD